MGLADDLVAKFAKAVNAKNDTKNTSGTKLQGTIHFKDDMPYVKLDGSDILTPVQLTANVIENERVTVTIKDHMAIVDGNLSSPAARTADLEEVKSQVEKIKDRRRSVYYQDEEPTDGEYENDDVWFDTDAGNKMHHYKDGEWVEDQFDSEAIAPKAITTEKIDAKAVRAAQIDVKDLFAQDIEASGKIIGGRFISKPMECWGGFAKEDLDLLENAWWDEGATLTDRQRLYFDLDSDGVIGNVHMDGVTLSEGGAIAAWLEGDDSFIPSSYFEKEGIDKCLCQVVIDTTNPDEAISIIIDRSYYGLSTIKHTVIGRSEAFFNYLTANRIRTGLDYDEEGTIIDHYIATKWVETDLIASMPDPNNDNKQVLKLDAPDGITANGHINANDGVNIPLLADNSGDTMVATPTAGTVNLSSTQGITDVLNIYKSFIGSIYAKNAWNNVISVRHRNGASDGNSHGMYLRSLMNNKTPDLIWAVQAAGAWQGERTILDSGNYSAKIPTVTQSAVGLMSAADKKKLDGIATGANAYSLPTASSSTLGGVKTTSTVTSNSGYTACPIISGVPYYKDTKVTVDSSMSTSSTNPVQNKVVKGQLPTSNQNATNGYIRFPSAKIQVAWIKKTVTTTITTPWGGLYENASAISIGNWAAAFSSVPAISYNVYVSSGDDADTGVNSFSPPTTTSAGSVYLNRGTALSVSRSYTITAIGIGTYA